MPSCLSEQSASKQRPLATYTKLRQFTLTFYLNNNRLKYDKQDQVGKAAFNERNPHTIQQQEPVARSSGEPQTKTGQGTSFFQLTY
jgi:hypothetical protein